MTDVQRMAKRCLNSLERKPGSFTNDAPGCSLEHITKILNQVLDGEVEGDKAHRFIGWAQAVMCIEGVVTLDAARDMNRKAIKTHPVVELKEHP